jgi:uncharacterized protein Yka (UPF0111/DUF47 family)
MGLQDVIRWLLPRDDVFFGLIERLTEILNATATELVKFADGAKADEVYETVHALEKDADRLVYESEEHFATVFVTPIDREDIQALIVAIDDIIDLMYLASRSFVLFGMPKPTAAMSEQMRLLVTLSGFLREEIASLRRHDYERLIAAGRTIREHEKTGDRIFREAVAQLFHDPDVDAKTLVRDKELLETLENAVDQFETVAERLKNLAVKHG